MLFNRQIMPSCSYCRFGTCIGDGEVACTKRGITSVLGSCNKYQYDPMKREPETLPTFNKDALLDISPEDEMEI